MVDSSKENFLFDENTYKSIVFIMQNGVDTVKVIVLSSGIHFWRINEDVIPGVRKNEFDLASGVQRCRPLAKYAANLI